MTLLKFLFVENEAVLDINTPSDYRYIKILRFMLDIISSWPRKQIGEPESKFLASLKYFYLFSSTTSFMSAAFFVKLNMNELSFFDLGHNYIIILMSFVNVSRVTTLMFQIGYRELAKEFLTKFHLFFYKDRSEYSMKTHKTVHLASHIYTLCLVGQMMTGLILFNLIPMYNNYAAGRYKSGGFQNSTFEHSIYLVYPFDTSTEIKGYTAACIIHWFLSYVCASLFCMFDLFLAIMVFHLWGHFKILINNLNDFPRPSTNSNFMSENGAVVQDTNYSEEELLQVSERLKECIIYHREIVHFTNTMSDVFGPMLFVYMLYHQTSGCLLLLECSQMTTQALMRYLPLTLISTQQLIQLSIIFELVGTQSEQLKHAVYGVPWECMDMKNRKVVLFFLMNVQEAVHVKALGVANVGVTSMAAILKTSISYFAFLRSM